MRRLSRSAGLLSPFVCPLPACIVCACLAPSMIQCDASAVWSCVRIVAPACPCMRAHCSCAPVADVLFRALLSVSAQSLQAVTQDDVAAALESRTLAHLQVLGPCFLLPLHRSDSHVPCLIALCARCDVCAQRALFAARLRCPRRVDVAAAARSPRRPHVGCWDCKAHKFSQDSTAY